MRITTSGNNTKPVGSAVDNNWDLPSVAKLQSHCIHKITTALENTLSSYPSYNQQVSKEERFDRHTQVGKNATRIKDMVRHLKSELVIEGLLDSSSDIQLKELDECLSIVCDFAERIGDTSPEAKESHRTLYLMTISIDSLLNHFHSHSIPIIASLVEALPKKEDPNPISLEVESIASKPIPALRDEELETEKIALPEVKPKEDYLEDVKEKISELNKAVLSPVDKFIARYERPIMISICMGTGGLFSWMAITNPVLTFKITTYAIIALPLILRIPFVRNVLRRALASLPAQKPEKSKDDKNIEKFAMKDRLINVGSTKPKVDLSNSSGASSISDDAIKETQGIKEVQITNSTAFFRSQLGVTAAYIPVSAAGDVQSLAKFCKNYDAKHPNQKSLFDDWYVTREVPSVRDEASDLEAVLRFTVTPGDRIFPLPATCSVVEIAMFDSQNRLVNEDHTSTIAEGVLGAFYLNVPSGVTTIQYAVKKAKKSVTQDKINRLNEFLPSVSLYTPDHQEALEDLLANYVDEPVKRAIVDYAIFIQSEYTYTQDPFVAAMQKRAGAALSESLVGMKMGLCDSFAYTVARRMNTLKLPALVLTGLVTKNNSEYDLETGHSQTVLPTIYGPRVFDATLHAKEDAIDSGDLSWHERAQALIEVNQSSFRRAFEVSAHIGRRLRNECAPEPIKIGFWDPLYRFFHWGLVPAGRKQKVERRSSNSTELEETHDIDDDDKSLAKALLLRAYQTGLLRAVERGLIKRDLNSLYEYIEVNPPDPLLLSEVRELNHDSQVLHDDFMDLIQFNPVVQAIGYTNSALEEKRLSDTANQKSYEWLFSHCGALFDRHMNLLKAAPADKEQVAIEFEEVLKYSSSKHLEKMDRSTRQKYFVALLNSLANHCNNKFHCAPSAMEEVYTYRHYRIHVQVDDAPFNHLFNTLFNLREDVADDLKDRSFSYRQNFITACLLYLGPLTMSESARNSLEENAAVRRGQLIRILSRFYNACSDWNRIVVAHYDSPGLAELFSSLMEESRDRDSLASYLQLPEGVESLNEYVASAVAEDIGHRVKPRVESERYFQNLEHALRWNFSLESIQDQIEEKLITVLRSLKVNQRYHLPSLDKPVSELLTTALIDEGSVLVSIAKQLETLQATKLSSLAKRWPATSETKLAKLNCERLTITEGFIVAKDPLVANNEISIVDDIRYYELILPDDHHVGAALFLERLGHFERGQDTVTTRVLANDYFRQFVLQHSAVTETCKTLEKEIKKKLINAIEVDVKEYYHAHLWAFARESEQHCEELYPNPLAANFLETVPFKTIAEDELSSAIQELTTARVDRFSGFPKLSEEAKICILLFRYLNAHNLHSINATSVRSIPERLRSLVSDSFGLQKSLSKEVMTWKRLEQGEAYYDIHESVTAAFVEAQQTFIDQPRLQRFRGHYRRYLESERGVVVVRGGSGSLIESRAYQQGDDLRYLDYKGSHRTDKLLVKQFESEELRDYHLVFDIDSLYAHYQKDKVNPALIDMFCQIDLAISESSKVDLWLPTRSKTHHFEDIGKVHHKSEGVFYYSERFTNEIQEALDSYYDFLAGEEQMLGKTLIEVNDLRSTGTQLTPGRAVVYFASSEKLKVSKAALQALRKRHKQLIIAARSFDD